MENTDSRKQKRRDRQLDTQTVAEETDCSKENDTDLTAVGEEWGNTFHCFHLRSTEYC